MRAVGEEGAGGMKEGGGELVKDEFV